MPRRLRDSTGGFAYHVLNRAVGRGKLFDNEADFLAMERVIERTHKRLPIRIISYCLMPNHWHLVLWPKQDDELSEFMRLMTVTHTQRRHAHHHTAGTGPLYQGRFKSFPIQQDGHFLTVCRYVERNAVRANLAKSARSWPWCGPAKRAVGQPPAWLSPIEQWPVQPPSDWEAWVDRPETIAELKALRMCVKRGRPYGDERWEERTAKQLGLESSRRPRGRQRLRSSETPESFDTMAPFDRTAPFDPTDL
jgi:putative transposase